MEMGRISDPFSGNKCNQMRLALKKNAGHPRRAADGGGPDSHQASLEGNRVPNPRASLPAPHHHDGEGREECRSDDCGGPGHFAQAISHSLHDVQGKHGNFGHHEQ